MDLSTMDGRFIYKSNRTNKLKRRERLVRELTEVDAEIAALDELIAIYEADKLAAARQALSA